MLDFVPVDPQSFLALGHLLFYPVNHQEVGGLSYKQAGDLQEDEGEILSRVGITSRVLEIDKKLPLSASDWSTRSWNQRTVWGGQAL